MVHIIPFFTERRPGAGDMAPNALAAGPLDPYWQEVAAHYERRMAQQQAFDTEIAARRLDGEIASAEADVAANAPADGEGLHQAMYGEVDPHSGRIVLKGRFDTLFDNFLKQAPPELRAGLASRKPALREAGSVRMAMQQNQRRAQYEQDQLSAVQAEELDTIAKSDPDDHAAFDAARHAGLDLIGKMNLDPERRLQAEAAWRANTARTRIEALIARDPGRATEVLSGGTVAGSRQVDPGTDPRTDLSADGIRQLLRQARAATVSRLIQTRAGIDLASQNAPDDIASTGSYSGAMPNPADFTAVYGIEEGGKRYQDFGRKIDAGRQAFGMRTMPNQAIHAALRDVEPGPGSSEEDQARYQVTAAAALKILGDRRADPAGYVREVFPDVDAAWSNAANSNDDQKGGDPEAYRKAFAISLAAQRQLGVERPQLLPTAVAQDIVNTLRKNEISGPDKEAILDGLQAAGLDPNTREALLRQIDEAGSSQPDQVDPITTAATGGRPSPAANSSRPESALEQAGEDFGNYLSEGFEALGRAPHGMGLILQDLRDSPLDFLERLPVTPGSGAVADGAAGLRWLGQSLLKGGKVAEEVIEPALRAFSKNYRKTFFKEYPELLGLVFVHHRIEQKVLKRYIGIISEEMMHSLENLRGIPKELNSVLHLSTIRREWDAFYRQNPTTTLQKLLEKADEIDQKYGHLFNPPVGKK